MWIALNTDQFIEFIERRNFFLSNVISCKDFIDKSVEAATFWIKIEDKFSLLGANFKGPVFLSNIKVVIPVTEESNSMLEYYRSLFPHLQSFIRRIEDAV